MIINKLLITTKNKTFNIKKKRKKPHLYRINLIINIPRHVKFIKLLFFYMKCNVNLLLIKF